MFRHTRFHRHLEFGSAAILVPDRATDFGVCDTVDDSRALQHSLPPFSAMLSINHCDLRRPPRGMILPRQTSVHLTSAHRRAAGRSLCNNNVHVVTTYTVWYTFLKMHKTLKMTLAMVAGASTTLWSMERLCKEMDAVAPKPGKRGPYKKKAA